MRIGIAWAGSAQHRNDANRSIPFELWRPLFEVPGLSLTSLMHPSHDRHDDWRSYDWARLETPLTPSSDFYDALQIVHQLDLVITVDTAVGHLCGGAGKPCWLLLAAAPDFRWGLNSSSSVWYPHHRLYRQPKAHTWETVIRTVAHDLTTFAQAA